MGGVDFTTPRPRRPAQIHVHPQPPRPALVIIGPARPSRQASAARSSLFITRFLLLLCTSPAPTTCHPRYAIHLQSTFLNFQIVDCYSRLLFTLAVVLC